MRYTILGVASLAKELQRKSAADFKKVERRNILQLRNRAVSSTSPASGGTPVDSNELRLSAAISPDGSSFGYRKDYAPHVEYGHRKRGGGYVPGQYYLRSNVNIQQPIFRQDLIKEMRK